MVNLDQIFVEVDDFCQQFIPAWEASLPESGEKQRRKPSRLSTSEVMTLLVLFHRYRSGILRRSIPSMRKSI